MDRIGVAAVDELLEEAVAGLGSRVGGGQVAVSVPSAGDRSMSWGTIPGGALVAADTAFYAGSVTKQLLAVLLARAVLAGRLGSLDPITEWLPSRSGVLSSVRIEHLVHHTSGLPSSAALALQLGIRESQLNNDLVMDGLSKLDCVIQQPGEAFNYSNPGYVALAEVLQAVEGASVPELAAEHLFGLAGMSDSRILRCPVTVLPGLEPPPATVGDGGLWTTAIDLLAWLRSMNERRFGREIAALTEREGRLNDGTGATYAWGTGPRQHPAGPLFIHGGSWPGWRAMTIRQPSSLLAVAALTAGGDSEVASLMATFLQERLSHLLASTR